MGQRIPFRLDDPNFEKKTLARIRENRLRAAVLLAIALIGIVVCAAFAVLDSTGESRQEIPARPLSE